MERRRSTPRVIVAIAAFAYVALAAAAFVYFRSPKVEAAAVLRVVGSSGALFLLFALLAEERFARNLGFDFSARAGEGKAFEAALKALGGTPLASLAAFVLLVLLYLGALAFMAGRLGLLAARPVPFFLFLFSFGLLAGAFVFVLSDRLCLTSLLKRRLTIYPAGLRENRQQRKIFIIPNFMALMSIVYGLSAAFLFEGEGGDAFAAGGGALVRIGVCSAFYFLVILVLMLIWNANTGLLYRSIIAQLERISQGERDLRGRISIASVDELGTMAGMVNSFCESLAGSVRDIAAIHGELSSLQARLFEGIAGSSASAKDIGASVEKARAAIEREDEALREALAEVEELSRGVDLVAERGREQGSRVLSSSEGLKSVMGRVGSLSGAAEGARARTRELAESVKTGAAGVEAVLDGMREVAKRSVELSEVNSLIAGVAARTNLLAMNAAIEAAHAGEAGAGFSVVAEEIRGLAESTAEHTRSSRESLAEILGLIDSALASAEKAGSSFGAVSGAASEVEAASSEIAAAMREEEGRSRDILGILGETERLGRDVSDTAGELALMSKRMAEGLEAVAAAGGETRALAEDMGARDAELLGSVSAVDALASRTAELAESLAAVIRAFRA